jgi:4-alpha-glucanotransferase
MLTIIPLQDWLATDDSLKHQDPSAERINIPANPDHE